jgi:hypothetical protein
MELADLWPFVPGLLQVSITFWRLMYSVASISTASLVMAEECSFAHKDLILLVHSSSDRHFNSFHFYLLGIIGHPWIIFCVDTGFLFSWEKNTAGKGIAGLHNNSTLNFPRKCHIIFQVCYTTVHFHQQCAAFIASHPSQHLFFPYFSLYSS